MNYEDIVSDALTSPLPHSVRRDTALTHKEGFASVVTGVRRSGKTRLLKQRMSNLLEEGTPRERMLFVDFEDDRLHPMDESCLSDILETYYRMVPQARSEGAYLFFDEIQEAPQWGRVCRRLLDSEPVELYLSGSSARMLSSELATELRGRTRRFKVTPLSFREFLRFRNTEPASNILNAAQRSLMQAEFAAYLEIGGFPGIQGDKRAERIETLQDYFETIVTRDIVERRGYPNYQAVRHYVREVLRNSGREHSVNKTYNTMKSLGVGMAKDLLYELNANLCDAYTASAVQIFLPSQTRRSQHPTKTYACDHGLSLAVSHARSFDEAQRLETAVYNEIARRCRGSREGEVSYYAERGKGEVDFVVGDVLSGAASRLYQVSVSLEDPDTYAREIKGAELGMERLGLDSCTLITLYEERDIATEHGTVHVVPAWKWCLDTANAHHA